MANVKKIISHTITGEDVYCIIERDSDGYLLNNADGVFASAPADPYIDLIEDGTIKGQYSKDESRAVWDDGKYNIKAFESVAGAGSENPTNDTGVSHGIMVIKNDLEVYLDATMRGTDSAALASALVTHDGKLDTVDTVVDGIQADLSNGTDGLGALKTLLNTIAAYVDELETRLTAVRAGYLDELAAANLPTDIAAIDSAISALNNLSLADIEATTVLAKTGADSDTLETLSDQIDALILTGARTITIQLYETGGTTPIADVAVNVFNSDQSLFLGRKTTDSNGQIVIGRNDGTYKIVSVKVGVTFTVPETMVVTTTETKTYYGDAIDIGVPSDSDVCRVYDYLYLADGATEELSPTVRAEIIKLPYSKDGKLHSGDIIDYVYNPSTGLIYWDIVKGSTVSFFIKDFIEVTRPVPALSTQRLATL